MLEKLAREQGNSIQAIFDRCAATTFWSSDLTGRRTCPVCGEIYNIYFKPPRVDNRCDLHPEAGTDVIARTMRRKRFGCGLETYERQTAPLLDYYEHSGRLERVDGTKSPEEIYSTWKI